MKKQKVRNKIIVGWLVDRFFGFWQIKNTPLLVFSHTYSTAGNVSQWFDFFFVCTLKKLNNCWIDCSEIRARWIVLSWIANWLFLFWAFWVRGISVRTNFPVEFEFDWKHTPRVSAVLAQCWKKTVLEYFSESCYFKESNYQLRINLYRKWSNFKIKK